MTDEIKLTTVDLSGLSKYVSIEKQMLLDAQKYIERASDYFKNGKYHHCAGCLAKAARKLERAEQLEYLINQIG